MRKAKLIAVLGMAFAIAVLVPAAHADSIGGPNCGTCQGSIYTLQYALASTGATTSIYDITYSINTTAYSGGGTQLDAVAFKVTSADPTAVSLDSSPAGTWTVGTGGINAGGCDGTGSGFVCASTTPGAGVPVPDGTYSWVFDITVPNGSLFTTSNAATIKAQYTNGSGGKVGALVSEGITLQPGTAVPEPGSLALLGLGVVGLLGLGVRRKQVSA